MVSESFTRIIVVRHGQTAWNEGEGERFRGRANIALDERGIKQAEATAAGITRWEIAAIYSSPLKRALDTAKIIAEPLKLHPQLLESLIDIDYGKWQGLSLKEAASDDRQLYELWLKSPQLVTFPQGESLEQVKTRAVATVETLVPQHRGQTIVLVSHKVVCKVLFCSFLGLDTSYFWKVQQDPCAISIAEMWNDSSVVTLLNDTCHLKGLKL